MEIRKLDEVRVANDLAWEEKERELAAKGKAIEAEMANVQTKFAPYRGGGLC